VVGSRFGVDLLTDLGIEPVIRDLVAAQLIDQVRFTRAPEYVFHRPLIRAVAYESQLKSDRADLHRRLAAAIEARDPASAEENASLIAEHLEAASDLHAAYGWHMRAATWATNRDIAAARVSWERATRIADAVPADDPDRSAMRIAPRTLLCGSAWRVHENISATRFEELRQLCNLAGDKASLAIGMAGLVMEHTVHARVREASRVVSEYMALLESIGDPTLTVGLSFAALAAKIEAGEMADVLRWTQTVVDLADGDRAKGNLIIGSPLTAGLVWRGLAKWCLGRSGWREDFAHAVEMARSTDPMSLALVVTYKYSPAIPNGVLLAGDSALRDLDEALQIAERSGDDVALGLVKSALALALLHRDYRDRDRGLEVLGQVRDMSLRDRFTLTAVPVVDVYTAQELARRGDRDEAIPLMRAAVDDLFNRGQLGWCVPPTGILVETLLARAAEGDLEEAQAAIDKLADVRANDGWAARDIWLLRMRALPAQALGHETAYHDYRDRYRAMATSLGFEGHIAWAEAMS
jgi:tetratricopeptide (TPR) repeat protein